jgi:hypothetical protein
LPDSTDTPKRSSHKVRLLRIDAKAFFAKIWNKRAGALATATWHRDILTPRGGGQVGKSSEITDKNLIFLVKT